MVAEFAPLKGPFRGQRAFDAVIRVRSRQRIFKPATRSASLKQTVPPDRTARAVTKVLPEQTLSVSVLSFAERAFLADAASLVAAVLPANAVSLALRVAAEAPMPHAGSQSGAAVRGSLSLIAFFCWS